MNQQTQTTCTWDKASQECKGRMSVSHILPQSEGSTQKIICVFDACTTKPQKNPMGILRRIFWTYRRNLWLSNLYPEVNLWFRFEKYNYTHVNQPPNVFFKVAWFFGEGKDKTEEAFPILLYHSKQKIFLIRLLNVLLISILRIKYCCKWIGWRIGLF